VPTPNRMLGTPRSAMPSNTAQVAGSANRSYSSGESDPAQLSKSWTTCAPAAICARSDATAIAAKRWVSCSQSVGSPCIRAFTRANVREGPPSTA